MSLMKFQTCKQVNVLIVSCNYIFRKPQMVSHLSTSCQHCLLPFKKNFVHEVSKQMKRSFTRNSYQFGISKQFQDSQENSAHFVHTESFPKEIQMKFQNEQQFLERGIPLSYLERHELAAISHRFNLQKLTLDSISKYNVRIINNYNSLMFPLTGLTRETKAVQLLTYKVDALGERFEESIISRENNITVFGWSLIDQNQSEIIITNNPLDAIAVNQETTVPTVAVPFEGQMFPREMFHLFGNFSKIVLWLDVDQHSWKTHKIFLEMFGKRTYFVRRKENSLRPLLTLQKGFDLKSIVSNAYPLWHEAIKTFPAYKNTIYNEFNDDKKSSGVKVRFEKL